MKNIDVLSIYSCLVTILPFQMDPPDLASLYRDPKFSASFSGKQRFYQAVKKKYPKANITLKQVDEYLKRDDSYTLHKPVEKIKNFRRVFTKRIGYLYQIDLVDMQKFKSENKGFAWIIVCIDTFSKKVWCFATKNKSAAATTNALRDLLTTNKPEKIQTDEGSEFLNQKFKKLCADLNIHMYTTYDGKKASIVERVNRTLKNRMYRYFTARGTRVWYDILDEITEGYNNTYHSSIKRSPNSVNKSNESKVRLILFPRNVKTLKKSKKFKVNDTVRISRKKHIFEKGYDQNFTHEVFYIDKIVKIKKKPTNPVTYSLRDYNNEAIKGSFYPEELQLIDKSDSIWPIEKILQQRQSGDTTEYLIKWKGYPNSFNSWVKKSDVFVL